MVKLSKAQKLMEYDRVATTVGGAGMGFWAATVTLGGVITMERFMYMNWIAIGLMLCGSVGSYIVKRQGLKMGHGLSQQASP